MNDFEERIKIIETNFRLPGTQITRTLHYHELKWCLAIGELGGSKIFFYGDSIEECLGQAEEQLARELAE